MCIISSLRFHNDLTHFWGPRDNEEKLNHRSVRKQLMNNSILQIIKNNCCLIALWFSFS